MTAAEVNFDGLVGPTHNYAGLSHGNIASKRHSGSVAKPRAAALQGLAKMKALMDSGLTQGVLPPHERPAISVLRQLGFRGTDHQVLESAWKQAPIIATNCYSASAMWTANAATISPWPDTEDQRTHITPANLQCMFHRSFEAEFTGRVLKTIFSDERYFVHHKPLPQSTHFGDEGAANHNRFCHKQDASGVEFFVFGAYAFQQDKIKPQHFPARQTFEASSAIARLHGLGEGQKVFAQQNPKVIDQGVFHNDVIAVGHQNLLFYHEQAFLNTEKVLQEIQEKMSVPMHFIEVAEQDVSTQTAIDTYLFNTQLINTAADGEEEHFLIVAPIECKENTEVKQYLDTLIENDGPIKQVRYFDLRQSMQNGGGPACLRLRVVMNTAQIDGLQARVILTKDLYQHLVDWVTKHYREQLSVEDLRSANLVDESRAALDELSQILCLGSIYEFQNS